MRKAGEMMDRERRQGRTILTVGCLLLLLTSVVWHAMAADETGEAQQAGDRKIAAKVNGQAIYEDQLEPGVQNRLGKYKKRGKVPPDILEYLKHQVLDELIDQELLNQASVRVEMADLEQRSAAEVEALKKKLGSDEAFQELLQRKKMTEKELVAAYRRQIQTREFLKQKGLDNPVIPEEEIRAFYEKGGNSFNREETIHVQHILLAVDRNAEPAQKDELRKKAESLRQELQRGKDFATLARENSQCSLSGKEGGDLGYIKKGYMPAAFDQAAFALNKGELSEVVESEFGFHLIQVLDKRPAGKAPYEEVREFIRGYLQSLAKPRLIDQLSQELRQNAAIETYLN